MATEPLLAATRRGRGQAEAFARSLHSKLRSLSGSEAPEAPEAEADNGTGDSGDGGGGPGGGNADDGHVRLCSSSSGDDVFFDMDLSPRSPEEVVEEEEEELEVLMVNIEDAPEESSSHDDASTDAEAARSGTSPQSDCSSDYFDPESFEDARTDSEEAPLLVKVVTCNGAADLLRCSGLEAPSTASPRRHPWNRVSHRHKAGTPEALRELEKLPREEDEDADERSAPTPSPSRKVQLGKFVFDKSAETILQEKAIEHIRQGKELPDELKNGLCLGPGAEAAAQAAADAAAEIAAEVAAVEIERELMDSPHESSESDERTPRVRRCSSLKTGKTPPGTPGRKKIVRFADVLGLDLADVRTFLDEIPRVPSSAYSDLSSVEAPCGGAEVAPLPQLALSFGAAPGRCLVATFQQPGGQPDFLDRIRERQVCLENAIVRDPSLLSIAGTVRVRNLDFHKSVHVRYTTDNWRSYADLQASYAANSCDGFSDKFTFVLYAAHTMAVGQRLEFAVRFQCKGQQFWDANNGANYAFECLPAASATTAMSMPMPMLSSSPDDSSWRSFY